MSAFASMREIKLIVLHCSASLNGDGRITANVIDAWHRQRGWLMIGYHYVIEVDGLVVPGRPESMVGAHCRGQNEHSIGVCLVGYDRFTTAQWHGLNRLLVDLLERYKDADVVGHRDLSPDEDKDGVIIKHEWLKTCPGFDVKDWLLEGPQPENIYKVS